MERPKRRKSIDNPYTIIETSKGFYVSFKDGNNINNLVEVSEKVFNAFNRFELEDKSQMNKYDRHIEHSEIYAETLYKMTSSTYESLDDEYIKKSSYEDLIEAINHLTSIDYIIGLKSILPNAKIINFEDDGEGTTKADLVFNALYNESEFPQIYAGEKYYICSNTFLFYDPIKIKKEVKNVFISFGGADPQNYSDRILNIISKPLYKKYNFIVVLGKAKNNVEELLKYSSENIKIVYDVKNMLELMSECDIAVTSRGRTGYELALLGIPSIAMAQNKREEKHGFVSNENGFSYIGLNPSDEIIEGTLKMYLELSEKSRLELQNKLLNHDLRNGRKRVMNLINNI